MRHFLCEWASLELSAVFELSSFSSCYFSFYFSSFLSKIWLSRFCPKVRLLLLLLPSTRASRYYFRKLISKLYCSSISIHLTSSTRCTATMMVMIVKRETTRDNQIVGKVSTTSNTTTSSSSTRSTSTRSLSKEEGLRRRPLSPDCLLSVFVSVCIIWPTASANCTVGVPHQAKVTRLFRMTSDRGLLLLIPLTSLSPSSISSHTEHTFSFSLSSRQ